MISNFTNTNYIYKSLENLGLSNSFDCVIVSEDVGWRKPHPAIFKKFLDTLNVKAEETLFVGDDLECDIVGAKQIGMKAAKIVSDDYQEPPEDTVKPDFIIHSLSDLKTLVTNAT